MAFFNESARPIEFPSPENSWVAGYTNRLIWRGLSWNASQHNYPNGSPFNLTFFTQQPYTDYGEYSIPPQSGSAGSIGVTLPKDVQEGNYRLALSYYVGGEVAGTQVVFAQTNFTIYADYEGPKGATFEATSELDAAVGSSKISKVVLGGLAAVSLLNFVL